MENSRRIFIRNSLITAGALCVSSPISVFAFDDKKKKSNSIHIKYVNSNFEREPLIRSFGFKGGYLTELWQTANYLESDSGMHGIGLSTQSILWSDAEVFTSHSESGGNALMYALTERALQMINGQSFSSPVQLLDDIFSEVYEFGKKVTSNPNLRKTFVLNALVGVDNAAWILYAKENGYTSFDEIIPSEYQPSLSHKHEKVAAIPLMAYNVSITEIKAAADQGYFFMKIKIGQPGTQEEMLEKDKARLTSIHNSIGNIKSPHTENGKLPYYFDANGRYEKKETLMKLIDHARKIGAFDQIAIIEEPFPEELEIDVSDIPVRLAADESAHTVEDAIRRIEMGYKAMALKPIAKTLSMTMKIAQAAFERNIPCLCADLTVNPILVEWNKNIAARLKSFPGLGQLGLMESNGRQNYKNWDTMMGYHPDKDAPWVNANEGLYQLNESFYRSSGGIFDTIPHYEAMFNKKI